MMYRDKKLIHRIVLAILLVMLQAAGQIVPAHGSQQAHGHCMEHTVHGQIDNDGDTHSALSDLQMSCCGAFAFLPPADGAKPATSSCTRVLAQVETWTAGVRAPPELPPPNA